MKKPIEIKAPSEKETRLAQQSASQLARLLNTDKDPQLHLTIQSNPLKEEALPLPATALQILLDILNAMGQGKAITLVPQNKELTTQEAADLLNVSRPYIVKLIDQKKLPAHKIGRHRRIKIEDLQTYKNQLEQDRLAALQELARETEQLGIEY